VGMAHSWFLRSILKFQPLLTSTVRKEACFYSSTVFPTKNAGKDKSTQISTAIQLYLRRSKEHEMKILEHRDEYNIGKEHLARIMGEDPDNFTQEQIDAAIEYLMPSGLFSPRARPKLKPPEDIFPMKKSLQCDLQGRPVHHMYYTRKPNYYALMHEAAFKLEDLKKEEDNLIREESYKLSLNNSELSLVSSEWISYEEFKEKMLENVSELDYKAWIKIMERIAKHPCAHIIEEFIMKHRKVIFKQKEDQDLPEPQIDPLSNRRFVESYGQRKNAIARLTLYVPGKGKLHINGVSLLQKFPGIGDREQIMFPLQYCGMLGKVDVEASVRDGGISNQASAIRLALARGIACFSTKEERERLRLAGLLTLDMRFKERKRPGRPKARKKFIWKAR
jgi:small subunit ribosomal protein S9